MKDSEVVEKALDILNEAGWCQGSQRKKDGRVCVGEALVVAITGDERRQVWAARLSSDTYMQFNRLAKRIVKDRFSIVPWNDRKHNSAEKVQDRLTTVAKELRNEGL